MMMLPTGESELQATHLLGILPSTVVIQGSSKEAGVVWFISHFRTFLLLIPNILEHFYSPVSTYLMSVSGHPVEPDINTKTHSDGFSQYQLSTQIIENKSVFTDNMLHQHYSIIKYGSFFFFFFTKNA